MEKMEYSPAILPKHGFGSVIYNLHSMEVSNEETGFTL